MEIAISSPNDASVANSIVNHPDVRPWMGYDKGDLDMTAGLSLMQVYRVGDAGVVAFEALGGGSYMVMPAFKPELWGGPVVASCRAIARRVFCETDAIRIYGAIDGANRRALRMAEAFGFTIGHSINERIPCELGVIDWAISDREMKRVGESIYRILGIEPDCNMSMFGWFNITCRYGWPGKAQQIWWIYSRLANAPDMIPLNEDGDEYEYMGRLFRPGKAWA